MSQPCIICVAITGSLPTKENNPNVPITMAEQIESTQEAFEAGATIAHCHVRDDAGKPTSDPERFARLKEGLRKTLPGHDHPVFNWRPVWCWRGAWWHVALEARHGLAFRWLQQLPDARL